MKTLLLIAHGSRRQESNDEIRRLAEKLRARVGARFDAVGHAYLEIAEPSIPDGIEGLIAQGATEVVVLPYFLAPGTHVREDIPAIMEAKVKEHPGVRIHATPFLGSAPGLVDVLAGLVDS